MAEVYCIIQNETGLMKFGLSKNPERRLAYLQTASGFDLTLIFSVQIEGIQCRSAERAIHNALESMPVVRRMRGEWFSVEPRQWRECVQDHIFWLLKPRCQQDEAPDCYHDFLLLLDAASG